MGNGLIAKKVLRSFLAVSMLSVLVATLGMMVDGVVVGNFLGEDSLAVMGIASPLLLVLTAISSAFSRGGATIYATYIGKGQTQQANVVFTMTLALGVVFATIVMALGFAFPQTIASILGGGNVRLQAQSVAYLQGTLAGTIPIVLSPILMGFTKIDNSKNLALVSVLVMTSVNIALDLAVVLVFDGGLFLIALATSFGYLACVFVCCTHLMGKRNTLRLALSNTPWKESAHIMYRGFPSALSKLCTTARLIVLNNILMLWCGIPATVALTVRTNIYTLFGAVTIGVAEAMTASVGVFYGERNRGNLEAVLRETMRIGQMLNVVAAIVIFLAARPFTTLFGVDPTASAFGMSVEAIRTLAVSLPFILVNLAFLNFYQSTRNTQMANIICLLQGFVITVVFSLALTPRFGATAIWVSFIVGEIMTLAIVIGIVAVRIRRMPRSLSDLMLLGDDFGREVDVRLDRSCTPDVAGIMALSEEVGAACTQDARDRKLARTVSMCIEELGVRTVEHGSLSQTGSDLEFRVVVEADAIILRLRFFGRRYDPLSDPQEGDDLTMKLIRGMTKRVEYRYVLGMNNLLVWLDRPTDMASKVDDGLPPRLA